VRDIALREEAAVAVGRRELLESLQAELLLQLESVHGAESARDAATLSKELRAVTAELESLAPAKESTVDDLAAKRAVRRTEAAG
jgi:hypothetical protein